MDAGQYLCRTDNMYALNGVKQGHIVELVGKCTLQCEDRFVNVCFLDGSQDSSETIPRVNHSSSTGR